MTLVKRKSSYASDQVRFEVVGVVPFRWQSTGVPHAIVLAGPFIMACGLTEDGSLIHWSIRIVLGC